MVDDEPEVEPVTPLSAQAQGDKEYDQALREFEADFFQSDDANTTSIHTFSDQTEDSEPWTDGTGDDFSDTGELYLGIEAEDDPLMYTPPRRKSQYHSSASW